MATYLASVKGIVALVTGAASGLGAGTARHLVEHGAKVVIMDLPQSKGETLAKEMGQNCLFTAADINVFGTFNVIQQALETFALKGKDSLGFRGVVINTASIAAYDGQVGQSAYAASKGAIISATLAFARDYAEDGIRFMTIAPGLFDTPLMSGLPEKVRTFLADLIPLPNRLGHPEEFGALVRHIIENRYLNGEVIRLDGGLRMPP
ncbi:unnamed protein product [Onchocerca flexuosa]|uniref:3-hydroxyacyl-CoA dehydrogenase type-2 n=1 Tax=Onchocerca flexuosa TaxID=387005 RepID=A0A183I6A2_9BILA|nr:unnamed protein product [Onchocerca flexuosa]